MGVYEPRSESQQQAHRDANCLSAEGRRLFLGSMLRVLIRRYTYGKPILRADVPRLVALADDAARSEGAPA
jgi:hypothetical protein